MNMQNKVLKLVLSGLFLLVQIGVVLAASDSHGGGGEHGGGGLLGIDWRVLIVQGMGFLVVFWVLKRYLFGPITKVIDERREHIRGTLDKIESDRTEMETLKSDYDHRLSDIEGEARDKIKEAVKRGEQLGDDVKATKEKEAEALVVKARENIAREREQSLIAMRQEIAEMALQMSSKLIHSELDKNKHRELIQKFIDELGTNLDVAKV